MSNDLQTARAKYAAELKNTLKGLEAEGRQLKTEYDQKFNALKKRHGEVEKELNRVQGLTGGAKKAAPKKTQAKKTQAKKVAPKKTATKATPKKTTKKVAKKAAPKKKAAAKKTTTKKAPKKKAAKKSKAQAIAAATQGRRAVAEGLRPPLKEAIATVIGKKQMDAGQVIDALKKKGWMPNAEDERGYISYALSSNKDVFERVSRGIYKVREGVTFKSKKKVAKKAKKTQAKKTTTAKKVDAQGQKTLDDIGVGGTGNNVAANPFVG